MKKYLSFYLSLFCTVFLLPFLATVFLSGTKVCTLSMDRDKIQYLPLLLSIQIEPDAPKEALKAQAVIARTNLTIMQENHKDMELYREILSYYQSRDSYVKLLKNYNIYEKAITDTTEVLTWNNEKKWAPYHAVSSGSTRDGTEVFHDPSYAYLISVKSPQDMKASNYVSSYYLEKEYGENLKILECDSADYVMGIMTDKEVISGEELRKLLGLSSSSFTMQQLGERLRILCKGKGHGLGLSQYGARVLAEQGESYIEILQYYFPKMDIT